MLYTMLYHTQFNCWLTVLTVMIYHRTSSGAYDHSVIFISAIGTICAESQPH